VRLSTAIIEPPSGCTHSAAAAEGWTQLATGAFSASYGLSYVTAVLFMLFFLVLLLFQGAVTKELVRAGRAQAGPKGHACR
jgi:preprotein translocase subunit SecG